MPDLIVCPDQDKLSQLLHGTASLEEIDSFAQHLETCSTCAQRIEETDATSPMLHVMRQPAQTSPFVVDGRMQAMMDRLDRMVSRPGDPQQTTATPCPNSREVQTSVEANGNADGDTEQDYLAWLEPAQDASEVGRLGAYRILKILGVGGMGVVYQAEDTTLKRTVALKAMKPALASSNSARQRFLREAQTAAAVRHDNVVTIYQAGEHNQIAFLAMEYLEGESLEDRLKRETRLTVAETLRIGREIADGLAAAHAHDLIHRDIKPSNLWLEAKEQAADSRQPSAGAQQPPARSDPSGMNHADEELLPAARRLLPASSRVKILDFGLARAGVGDVKLTQSGTILGTPAYMAPEQAEGQPVDARADLFSLGCVLYRMATGEMPFTGDGVMQILRSIALAEPRQPRQVYPEIPIELSELIMKLLEKNPARRIRSAREVIAAFQDMEAAPSRRAVPRKGRDESAQGESPRRKNPLLVAVALLAGLFIAAVGIYVIIRISTPEGDYVINTDDPDFSFSVSKETVILNDKKTKREYKLKAVQQKPGEFELEVTDQGNDLVFNTKTFSIKRGETVALKAWFERKQVDAASKADDGPPATAIATGGPMSPLALVTKPAKIAGVKSWTIETADVRGEADIFAFSPDSTRIAIWSSVDPTVRIRDARKGALIHALVGCEAQPYRGWNSLAWSKDGKSLACTDIRGNAYRWNANAGNLAWKKRLDIGEGHCVAWAPDGTCFAVGGSSGLLKILRSEDGEVVDSYKGEGSVMSLSWSQDSARLASSGMSDKAAKIWNTKNGKLLTSVKLPDPGHESYRSAFHWSPNGKTLAVSHRRHVVLCDSVHYKIIHTYELDPTRAWADAVHVDWAPDGESVKGFWATKGYWDAASEKWTQPLQPAAFVRVNPNRESHEPIAWSPDGKVWIANAVMLPYRMAGMLNLWSRETGKSIWEIQRNPAFAQSGFRPANPSLSPDGKHLAIFSVEDVVRIVDPRTGAIVKALRPNTPSTYGDLVWSPDSRRLLILKPTVSTVYDLIADRSYNTGGGTIATWSNDSKMVAVCSGGSVTICDAESGNEYHRYNCDGIIADLAASPTDRIFAAADGKSKRLSIFDYGKKEFIKTEEAKEVVRQLAWSPDGKRIAGGALGHPVWDVSSGKIVLKLDRAYAHCNSGPLVWSADSKTITGGDEVGNVCQWDASSGKLLRKEKGEWPKSRTNLRYVPLANEQFIAISPEGHYRGTPNAERHIVYVVQTDNGQETLSPAEMAKKYRWQNDPDKVRLTGK